MTYAVPAAQGFGRTENMIGLALNAGMLAETGNDTLRTVPARLTMSGPEGIVLQNSFLSCAELGF